MRSTKNDIAGRKHETGGVVDLAKWRWRRHTRRRESCARPCGYIEMRQLFVLIYTKIYHSADWAVTFFLTGWTFLCEFKDDRGVV
jgi:hypothetical protein